ncbi:hypothetical protein ACGE24_06985 [Corynebacterium kroppenstedtii]|uniref:hypothetical protein n=1 Tax=Corynebacterium sp. PCR 32 TaxID=3351342 RepID=UPI0030B3DA47
MVIGAGELSESAELASKSKYVTYCYDALAFFLSWIPLFMLRGPYSDPLAAVDRLLTLYGIENGWIHNVRDYLEGNSVRPCSLTIIFIIIGLAASLNLAPNHKEMDEDNSSFRSFPSLQSSTWWISVVILLQVGRCWVWFVLTIPLLKIIVFFISLFLERFVQINIPFYQTNQKRLLAGLINFIFVPLFPLVAIYRLMRYDRKRT